MSCVRHFRTSTNRLHSSSFFGVPYGILKYKSQKGTTMEPMGKALFNFLVALSLPGSSFRPKGTAGFGGSLCFRGSRVRVLGGEVCRVQES